MAKIGLKPSMKGVTILIVIAVVIFFGCVLAYLGAAGKLKSAVAEYEDKLNKVKDAKQIATKLEKAKFNYYDSCAQLRFLESNVTTYSYVPTLLKQLEQVGESANVKVIGVRPEQSKEKSGTRKLSSGAQAANGNIEGASQTNTSSENKQTPSKPYDELSIAVEIQSTYMNALDFIYRLTRFPKVIAVNSVEMAPVDVAFAGSPTLTVKMKITAFIIKESTLTGTKKAEITPVSNNPSSEGRNDNEAG